MLSLIQKLTGGLKQAIHFKDCAHLWSQNETREERRRGGSRRPIVPITDILGLGKHGPLKLSQKHTLLKSKDKPPLSRRCVHVCMCVHVWTSVCTQLPRGEINGLETETGDSQRETLN